MRTSRIVVKPCKCVLRWNLLFVVVLISVHDAWHIATRKWANRRSATFRGIRCPSGTTSLSHFFLLKMRGWLVPFQVHRRLFNATSSLFYFWQNLVEIYVQDTENYRKRMKNNSTPSGIFFNYVYGSIYPPSTLRVQLSELLPFVQFSLVPAAP